MRRYRYAAPAAIVLIVVAMTLARGHYRREGPDTRSSLMMDTVVQASVWGQGRVPGAAAVDSALSELERIASLLGDCRLDSRSDARLLRSPEVLEMLRVARDVYDLSGGLFDPTVGSLTRLWAFGEGAHLPDPDSIAEGLRHVGLPRYLEGDASSTFVLDLGGIAKGYAVDLAAARLARLGFKSAIVTAGGDMRLVGRRPDGKPWRIAIRHPRQPGRFIGFLRLEDVAVATSGDYERCFFLDGKRYHHILDPRSGMPGGAAVSVTVVAPTGARCDALATALFLAGPHEGLRLAEGLDHVEAVFVWAEGESLAVTSGLGDKFERGGP